jgi:hypothetical protein
MIPTRHHLTLIDLMATVVAAALCMGVLVWGGLPSGLPALVVIVWLICPLVGILGDRWRGGRGILGGALGGAAYAGFWLIWLVTGPHGPGQRGPSFLINDPAQVVFGFAGCGAFGALMGVAAWLVAAMMGRSVAPASPSPND